MYSVSFTFHVFFFSFFNLFFQNPEGHYWIRFHGGLSVVRQHYYFVSIMSSYTKFFKKRLECIPIPFYAVVWWRSIN